MATKPQPKLEPPAPLTQPDKPKSAHHQNLGKYGVLGGRPSKTKPPKLLQDESHAFDSIKDKWTLISHKLADEALQAARSSKKIDGRSLVAITTSAGIAYDKRWSKQTHDTTEIELPASLVTAVSSKLRTDPAKPAEVQTSAVMVSPEPLPSEDVKPDAPIDPLLLCPGG